MSAGECSSAVAYRRPCRLRLKDLLCCWQLRNAASRQFSCLAFLDPGKATELRTLGPCNQVEFSSFDLQLRRCLMYSNQHSVERVHQGFSLLVDKNVNSVCVAMAVAE